MGGVGYWLRAGIVIVLGLLSIVAGVAFAIYSTHQKLPIDQQYYLAWAGAMIGVGGSLWASFIAVFVLDWGTGELLDRVRMALNINNAKLTTDNANVLFVGDRNEFKAEYLHRKEGWDDWIRETPKNGEIIICGRQNRFWFSDSHYALKSAIERQVTIRVFFFGDHNTVNNDYVGLKKIDEANSRILSKCECYRYSKEFSDRNSPTGFYWNGTTLIVKAYLPGIEKPDDPLIVFRLPKAQIQFDDDPDLSHYPTALRLCLESLRAIKRNWERFDNLPTASTIVDGSAPSATASPQKG